MSASLLAVEDLKVHFPARKRLFRQGVAIRAVDGVSFSVAEREVVGLVGKIRLREDHAGARHPQADRAHGGHGMVRGARYPGSFRH